MAFDYEICAKRVHQVYMTDKLNVLGMSLYKKINSTLFYRAESTLCQVAEKSEMVCFL